MVLGCLIMLQPRRESFHQNQFIFNTGKMNLWSSELNAFLMSIVTKYPPILLRTHISTISYINLPPSPINLSIYYT